VAVWLIVNPKAGAGRAAKVADALLPLLHERRIDPIVHVCSDGAEPARRAAEARASGVDMVLAVGGDGLVAGVAEGMLADGATGAQPTLAVVPTGSANDYARALGVRELTLADHVALMADGNARASVDVMRVETAGRVRHVLNVGGTGFDAVVADRAAHITRLRGAPRYVAAMLTELPRFKGAGFEIELDGERRATPAMMVTVANGSTYGGGMRVAPSAHLQSGWLDICIIGQLSRLEFLRAFPRVFRGSHVTHPAVTMLRARQVRIAADRPLSVLGDGETIGALPATFHVRPAALTVVAAPGASLA
jgi:diacylglycerol kinase (ATP)